METTQMTQTKRISFKCSADDSRIIRRITDRAMEIAERNGVSINEVSLMIDITACHNSCPLDLAGLAGASDGDLAHDVFGIRRYMDHNTGELGGCFVPRYLRCSEVGKQKEQ